MKKLGWDSAKKSILVAVSKRKQVNAVVTRLEYQKLRKFNIFTTCSAINQCTAFP